MGKQAPGQGLRKPSLPSTHTGQPCSTATLGMGKTQGGEGWGQVVGHTEMGQWVDVTPIRSGLSSGPGQTRGGVGARNP